ncbi:alpha/beta hydrolase [Parvularcula sp. ZS-1/3]|uniref:Alpha/beta hydrolase n=1 Tax=Parvularcula mediterranea TaxID=2732508 RepID=A0A7Y3RN16_9PROT|nr:alpha/beta hydrolase [Parvularcula mediterranea]NNU17098.1 alpha/beta hydrolase [Parvularcula mediterranea]
MMVLASWKSARQTLRFEGHDIAYWTDGDGPPLLLIHGFPTSSHDWTPIWQALTEKYRVIACDLLGFGLSAKPSSGYSIHRQADLQEALLGELGISHADLLVHDYGVSVGQELLARENEGGLSFSIGQMVFLNGGIFPGEHRPRPIQKLGASPLGFLISLLTTRERFGKSFSEVFGPETQPTKQELDTYWSLICENSGNRITHKLLGYMKDREVHKERWVSALGPNQARIGLINGALDPVSGEHVFEVWRRELPDARAHLLPTIGHYPQVEAQEAVASKVLEWLG